MGKPRARCAHQYWTLDIQKCTFRNNLKHIVAYHIDIPWNTIIHRLSFDGTENDELAFPDTDNSDRKSKFAHSNTLHQVECSQSLRHFAIVVSGL